MDFVSLASLPAKYLEYKSISFPHAISKPCYCIAICWCSHYHTDSDEDGNLLEDDGNVLGVRAM